MPSTDHAALHSGCLTVPVTLALVLAALVYTRGWYRLRGALPNLIPVWRLAVFMTGLFSIWIAVGSPLATLDAELLSIHMVQHLLLMAAGAPLILVGAPVLPFLHGLPECIVHSVLGPLLRCPSLRSLGRALTHPVFCWLAGTVAVIGWHVPAAFELASRSHWWHETRHASFFAAGLLFWWPVVQPWPSVAKWPRWSIPLYLFFATLPCDALSAFLTFCDRVVYQSCLSPPRLLDISPLRDQESAGALMWVCITFIYLLPAVAITIQILSPPRQPNASQLRLIREKPAEARYSPPLRGGVAAPVIKAAKPPKRRRRGGQFGEMFKNAFRNVSPN